MGQERSVSAVLTRQYILIEKERGREHKHLLYAPEAVRRERAAPS